MNHKIESKPGGTEEEIAWLGPPEAKVIDF